MTKSDLIEPHHLKRRAVIYIRQSTGHQVLTNVESRKLQHAMREHARRLGWTDSQIHIVESDTGNSAQSTANRGGYQNLLSDIALGQVGIVISYESARLSRNCSDWYPLMDLCAFQKCLIGDRDGVYDPLSANGRLLLGMKGILSEVELHTLRGRLIAGIQNKARRGELALALPAGLVRLEDGRVDKDPNLQVQEAIELVFRSFLDLKSAAKVVRYFKEHGLKIPRRHRNQETVWRPASVSRIVAILRNPAYAGAFAYGKTGTVRKLDGTRLRQKRRAMEDWTVLLKDRHPAYISWETFESIQKTLSDNYAEYDRNKSRGTPRDGAALVQGLAYCGQCGHKMVVQYKGGARYLCNFHRQQKQQPVCQYLPAAPIDEYVVNSFFQAISPAELDLYELAMQQCDDRWVEVKAAQQRELQRLRYEVDLARRQYDRVDPDNRLVAAELERRWESALRAVHATQEQFDNDERKRDKLVSMSLPPALRNAFKSLGQSLPGVWAQTTLSREQRKQLLRCLIDKVVVHRKEQRELVHVRIVWRGGAISEHDVSVHVRSLSALSGYEEMEAQLLSFEESGKSDEEIADILTERGFHSPQSDKVLASTVKTIRLKNGRIHRFRKPRPRRVDGYLTTPQVAERLGVKPHWLYHLIKRGVIDIKRDPDKKMYLFPDRAQVIENLAGLRDGTLQRVSI